MVNMRTLIGTLCLIAFIRTAVSSGQTTEPINTASSHTQYAFDVVSIHPSAKEGYSHWRTGAEGYSATNVTAQQIMFYAFNDSDEADGTDDIISLDQIRGLPKWATSEQFDITAKLDGETMSQLSAVPEEKRDKAYQSMLQAVLKDRCQLEVHHEKIEQPVYFLDVTRRGSKLVPSDIPLDKSSLSTGLGQIKAEGYGIGELASLLAEETGRVVVDRTHLTGKYTFQLNWRPDSDTDATNSNPSIYTALKEQLGLSLVPSKAYVDSIVVTRLNKPTEN